MVMLLPATSELLQAFREEITSARGTVLDVFEDGSRLFVRSTLTACDEVRPGDTIQAGVALRTQSHEVLVHPYTFRQVCRNGTIVAQALESRRIKRVSFSASSDEVEQVLAEVREAVGACSAPEAFWDTAAKMQSAADVHADFALQLLPMLSRLTGISQSLMDAIWERFEESDRSLFAMTNAVTATARDQPDPELRWRLEELGGGVLALLKPTRTPDGARKVLVPTAG